MTQKPVYHKSHERLNQTIDGTSSSLKDQDVALKRQDLCKEKSGSQSV